MLTTTNIHNVTTIRAGALETRAHDDGQPYYWRVFTFTTADGGEVRIAAFADNPAALPEFPAQSQQEPTP